MERKEIYARVVNKEYIADEATLSLLDELETELTTRGGIMRDKVL